MQEFAEADKVMPLLSPTTPPIKWKEGEEKLQQNLEQSGGNVASVQSKTNCVFLILKVTKHLFF